MNKPTAKKLIESAPEHILNMGQADISIKIKKAIENVVGVGLGHRFFTSMDFCQEFKIAIDWVGDECVCYPFQNVHTPTLGEQATLLSISDRNPRIAIAKAVIWQQEVLAKSN